MTLCPAPRRTPGPLRPPPPKKSLNMTTKEDTSYNSDASDSSCASSSNSWSKLPKPPIMPPTETPAVSAMAPTTPVVATPSSQATAFVYEARYQEFPGDPMVTYPDEYRTSSYDAVRCCPVRLPHVELGGLLTSLRAPCSVSRPSLPPSRTRLWTTAPWLRDPALMGSPRPGPQVSCATRWFN